MLPSHFIDHGMFRVLFILSTLQGYYYCYIRRLPIRDGRRGRMRKTRQELQMKKMERERKRESCDSGDRSSFPSPWKNKRQMCDHENLGT